MIQNVNLIYFIVSIDISYMYNSDLSLHFLVLNHKLDLVVLSIESKLETDAMFWSIKKVAWHAGIDELCRSCSL